MSLMMKQSNSPFSKDGVNSRHNQSLFILVAHTACVTEANTFTYHADLRLQLDFQALIFTSKLRDLLVA